MFMIEVFGDFDLDLILLLVKKDILLGLKVLWFGNILNVNWCFVNMLVLRGSGSFIVDVSRFEYESFYFVWLVDYLSVVVNFVKFGKYEMLVGLLCNC